MTPAKVDRVLTGALWILGLAVSALWCFFLFTFVQAAAAWWQG